MIGKYIDQGPTVLELAGKCQQKFKLCPKLPSTTFTWSYNAALIPADFSMGLLFSNESCYTKLHQNVGQKNVESIL